ncbi:MAG: methyltransferase domain-containing protein [Proteobacteria bacterium]|nr:methyltransferase domain-containing protein [Pseudomonadota bacterium]MCP4916151.1 methyltransferase domain-containing protein [Pseudomonadota bacterium]
MKKPSTNVQFTPYEISMCLHDVHRTRLWKQAIEDLVRPGDIVVDAGAGTGILSMFAAKDGAARVHAIELHPRFVALIEHMAELNEVSDKVQVHHADASRLELSEPIDLLICELLCTGQFFEPEVQVVNHLRQYLAPGGRILPSKVESFVQLLDAQKDLYGVRIDTDSRSDLLAGDEPVSTRARYDVIDFGRPVEPARVDATVELRARKTRVADAVVITSRAWLTEDLVTERTRFLYNPEVIYLKREVQLEEGRTYRVHIAYDYGCDTLDVELDVTPV